MPSREELRLARAKALCGFIHKECVQGRGDRKECNRFTCRAVNAVIAIESADAAMGVVSVPVEVTDDMVWAGGGAIDHPTVDMAGPKPGSRYRASNIWRAMLAASPLAKETPDE